MARLGYGSCYISSFGSGGLGLYYADKSEEEIPVIIDAFDAGFQALYDYLKIVGGLGSIVKSTPG